MNVTTMLFVNLLLTFVIPAIIIFFLLKWVRSISINFERQIEQNEQIISLLKENQDHDKSQY